VTLVDRAFLAGVAIGTEAGSKLVLSASGDRGFLKKERPEEAERVV